MYLSCFGIASLIWYSMRAIWSMVCASAFAHCANMCVCVSMSAGLWVMLSLFLHIYNKTTIEC